MSKYRPDHYHGKQTRAVTGEPGYKEKRHRSKFGDPDQDAKPVGTAPPVEIAHPKDVARQLQPTYPQAGEREKSCDHPEHDFFRDSHFRHSCTLHIRLWIKSTNLLRSP